MTKNLLIVRLRAWFGPARLAASDREDDWAYSKSDPGLPGNHEHARQGHSPGPPGEGEMRGHHSGEEKLAFIFGGNYGKDW